MNQKKINLNHKTMKPLETIAGQAGVMQAGAGQTGAMTRERFDSRCNTEIERARLIDRLKECYSQDEIDKLFDALGVSDYAMRSAILRECMNAVYILSSWVIDPALEGMSKEKLAEVEYEMEKSTFLDGYWR